MALGALVYAHPRGLIGDRPHLDGVARTKGTLSCGGISLVASERIEIKPTEVLIGAVFRLSELVPIEPAPAALRTLIDLDAVKVDLQ